MLLILCALDDLDTLAFARRAGATGVDCRILTAEALSFARRRSHRISGTSRGAGASISVRTEIEALDLPPIRDNQLSGVLNRLVEPPAAAWRRATEVEREYATAELFAFTLSWLTGLDCPVRNRPTPGCLAGPVPHPARVVAAARQAGLNCPQIRYHSGMPAADAEADLGAAALTAAGPQAVPAHLVCLDGEPLACGDAASVPGHLADPIRSMLSLLGCAGDLVGLDFAVHGGRWVFAGLTPLPRLSELGTAGRAALLATLAPSQTAVA